MRRRLLILGAVALMAAGWLTYGPAALGGPVSYAIVSGSSMEPVLHRGDLVVVRPAERYHVGEIIAYRTEGGATILHRIVGRAGEGYVLQGDANSWLDPFQPTDRQVLGRLQRHFAGVGRVIDWLRRPVPASVLVGVVAFYVGVRYQRRWAAGPASGTAVLVMAVAILALGIPPAGASPNSVPATRLGRVVHATNVNELKPSECSSITLTTLKVSSGVFSGTSADELLLGSAGIDSIDAKNGNDCLVGGGASDTLNGGGGTDVCVGGPATTVNIYVSCETTTSP